MNAIRNASGSKNSFVENLEGRRLMANSFDGVVANTSYDDAAQVVPVMNDLGTNRVRLWHTTDFTTHSFSSGELSEIQAYKTAGKEVTLVFNLPEDDNSSTQNGSTRSGKVTYANVKGYFDWLTQTYSGAGQLLGAVDRFEIVNEINLPRYYPQQSGGTQATMDYYVSNTLRGAYDSLDTAGETVVGGNVQDVTKVDELANGSYTSGGVTKHYTDFCDIASVHPYASSVASAKTFIDTAVTYLGSKPITATEWNLDLNGTPSATSITQVHDYMEDKFESAFFYRLHGKSDDTGKLQHQGLVNVDYSKRQPYYDMFKGWGPATPPSGNEDTYVYDGAPTTNYGNDGTLIVKNYTGSGYTRQTLLRFDLTGYTTTNTAKIRLFGNVNSTDSVIVSARSVSGSWVENSVTWNSRPTVGATNLGSATVSGSTKAWYEIDVSSYVQQQVANGATSVSFALVGNANTTSFASFNSTEAATNEAQLVKGGVVQPTTIYNAIGDSYAYDGATGTNYGSSTTAQVKRHDAASGFTRQSFLKFDVSNLTGTVNTAKIRVYGNVNAADSVIVAARGVADPSWDESTLTWNLKPTIGATDLGTVTTSGSTAQWYEIDVTSYVQQRRAAGDDLISFALVGNDGTSSFFSFNTSEASSNQVQLKVN